VDRRFIAGARDEKFPYDTALVLGMEMDRDLLDEVPRPGDRLFDFETYVESGRRVFDVAGFIRSRGYRCYARVPFDGWVKYPVHAINAGLGELGANGVVITREYGPRVRWTMISIDAELPIDPPVDLGMAAFCDACRLCIRACPGKAIPAERIWWRGVLKRKINDTKCYPYFLKYEGCGICLKVCPIHRFGYDPCMRAYGKDGTVLGRTSTGKVSAR
jgi:ferredoxin